MLQGIRRIYEEHWLKWRCVCGVKGYDNTSGIDDDRNGWWILIIGWDME